MHFKIFNSSAEFREWLENNHDRVGELWLGFYNKRTDKQSITYREALDEALCFGWIDGVHKSINETTYKQRLTPRRAKSYWSAVNIKRIGELAKLSRVAPAGVKAFEQRTSDSGKYSFESRQKELPPAYKKHFKANRAAWEFFQAQAPWYQRTCSFWVVSAKQEATRQRRLATLIRDSAQRQRLRMLMLKAKKTYSEPSVQAYKPQAVLAHLANGGVIAALCYNLAEPLLPSERNPEYAMKLRAVGHKVGLPTEYISSFQ